MKKDRNEDWFCLSQHPMDAEWYLQLHAETTRLAYAFTGVLETAEDLASECLIACCLLPEGRVPPGCFRQSVCKELIRLWKKTSRCTHRRVQAESVYSINRLERFSVWQQTIDDLRVQLQYYTRWLEPDEALVITYHLVYCNQLEEIASMLKRSVAVIRKIRDRAVVKLRKLLKTNVC